MNEARFAAAVAAFAAISAEDPQRVSVDGSYLPRELAESERLEAWLERLSDDVSEPLRLAAHCQHVGRHRLPRASYPEGRTGYLRWRAELARRHAATAEDVLREVGYDDDTIERVRRIVKKEQLAKDAEVQSMEDALCLDFLAHDFEAFSLRHSDEKLVTILRKTWRKMSERAQKLALTLPLSPRALALVERALATGGAA